MAVEEEEDMHDITSLHLLAQVSGSVPLAVSFCALLQMLADNRATPSPNIEN